MRRILVGLLIVSFGVPVATAQQTARGLDDQQWAQVQQLTPGTKLRLSLPQATEIEGLLVQVTPDALVLRDSRVRRGLRAGERMRDEQSFQRSDLRRVTPVEKGMSGLKKGLIIAGVAAGAFFLLVAIGLSRAN